MHLRQMILTYPHEPRKTDECAPPLNAAQACGKETELRPPRETPGNTRINTGVNRPAHGTVRRMVFPSEHAI
jgi:hypothetical protein